MNVMGAAFLKGKLEGSFHLQGRDLDHGSTIYMPANTDVGKIQVNPFNLAGLAGVYVGTAFWLILTVACIQIHANTAWFPHLCPCLTLPYSRNGTTIQHTSICASQM